MQQDVYATNNSIRFNHNLGLGSDSGLGSGLGSGSTTSTSTSTYGKVIAASFTNTNFFNHSTGTFFLSTGTPIYAGVTSTATTITLVNSSFQYTSTDTTIIYATIVSSTDPLFRTKTNLATSDGTDVSDQTNSLWSASLTAGSRVTCNIVFCDLPSYSQTYYYGVQINTNGSGTFQTANIIVTGA